jgi:hypothetical protein
MKNNNSKINLKVQMIKESISEDAIWSEKSLAKTWMNKEEDEAWKDL